MRQSKEKEEEEDSKKCYKIIHSKHRYCTYLYHMRGGGGASEPRDSGSCDTLIRTQTHTSRLHVHVHMCMYMYMIKLIMYLVHVYAN